MLNGAPILGMVIMSQGERLLIVPVPSLVATLLSTEQDKGSALTESEVIAI
jgi:hypothetical protein